MNIIKNILITILVLTGLIFPVTAADFDYSKLTETLLNQDPDPAEPGEYVEIRFKVEKEGNEAIENIEYELVPTYPFSFDSSDTPIKKLGDIIGNLEDDEHYILYYKLKVDENAIEDIYELSLKQRSSETLSEREIEFEIRVGESQTPNLLIGNINTVPAKLIADYDEAEISVEIINNGEGEAKQVVAELIIPNNFEESFGYSTRTNLGNIIAGSTNTAKFYLDTQEELFSGAHKTKIKLTYKEDTPNAQDEVKTIEIPFDIKVFGRPSYEILNLEVNELTPGKLSGEFKLQIKNTGSRESDSTSVQVFKDSSQPFDFDDKSDFIGKLAVGETADSLFTFEVDEDAEAKEYRLKLQIRSVVDNDVLVEDEVITLKVEDVTKAPKAGENSILRFMLYGVFLIIGIFIGIRFGKNLKVKKK